jgi:hypothetical protein
MAKTRRPEFLTAYLCWFCGTRIEWGTIVRMLRSDPGQPDYMEIENYAHLGCVRTALLPEVPLAFAGDQHLAKCGFCGKPKKESVPSRLTLQRPTGSVRKPEFSEARLIVHLDCMIAAANRMREPKALP